MLLEYYFYLRNFIKVDVNFDVVLKEDFFQGCILFVDGLMLSQIEFVFVFVFGGDV